MDYYTNSLSSFERFLDETIEHVWAASVYEEYIDQLYKQIPVLAEKVIEVGDQAHELITERTEDIDTRDLLNAHFITFLWPELGKSFLILWRDILFQQQKAQVLYHDQRLKNSALEQLKVDSKKAVRKAVEEWKLSLSQKIQGVKSSKGGSSEQLFQWSLQTNPWPVYRQQIKDIIPQAENLQEQYQALLSYSEIFQQIGQRITKSLAIMQEETNSIVGTAQKAEQFIIEHIEESPGKISPQLEEFEKPLKSRSFYQLFAHSLEKQLETLGKRTQAPIATRQGIIQYKDVNFQRNAEQWLESEVLPLLNEAWELLEKFKLSLKMSLLNIRNRIGILSDEETGSSKTELVKKDIGQPLKVFLDKVKEWEERSDELKAQLIGRMVSSFYVSTIYDSAETFLPIPLQSTLNQLKQNQNLIASKLQSWWASISRYSQQVLTSVELEESLSKAEKITRLLHTRTPESQNNHYTSIFLTKGQIGKSFWVGRVNELERIKKLHEDWEKGFRGAVLLTGQRFSGKTLFGDLIANQYFDERTVRLSPGSNINLSGRNFQCTTDLAPALEFIIKHGLFSKILVWIDDIELWRDTNTPLSQNVRVLQKYIDHYSGRIFFMASTSNWSIAHLQTAYQLKETFQAEVNLDRMRVEEITQAILVRHGATHKILVDRETGEVSSLAFKKLIANTFKASEGNIGEAINQWSYSTRKHEEDSIVYEPSPGYQLPDFLTPAYALLLTSIMMGKRMNEYRLHKRYGPAFNEKYAASLQRLIRMGLLIRHMDGELEIHTGVVNEIGKLLAQKNYLKFYH